MSGSYLPSDFPSAPTGAVNGFQVAQEEECMNTKSSMVLPA